MRTYFKKLRLINFQSHKDSEFIFKTGLNIIAGPSDQGKTAVIRALRWLIYNEPRGTSFIRTGETRCQVRLELSNGTTVERIRDVGVNINRYLLTLPGEETQVFERFNKEVPVEIRQAIGIHKLTIDRDKSLELNIAGQLDAPFLLDESGSTRSKVLGRVANLHIIDAAQREVIRDINQANQEAARLEEEVERLESEIDAYAGIEREEAILRQLEDSLLKVNGLEELVDQMAGYQNAWRQNRTELESCSELLGRLSQLEQAVSLSERLKELTATLEKMQEMRRQYHQVKEGIRSCRATIDETNNIDQGDKLLERMRDLRDIGFKLQTLQTRYRELDQEKKSKSVAHQGCLLTLEGLSGIDQAEELLERATAIRANLGLMEELFTSRRSVLQECEINQKNLGQAETSVEKMVEAYSQLLLEAGRCPVCLSEINQETTDRIRRELI